MSTYKSRSKKVTIPMLKKMKKRGEKIAMLTAYDATFGRILDRTGIEVLLVGDSLGMVIQGHDNTIPVTLEQTIYHCQCVSRGLERAHLVADMPFMTYHHSIEQAICNCGRAIKEGGAESVKLEGGGEIIETVAALTRASIPVMGHVGLKPQSVYSMGGYRVQGKERRGAEKILAEAKALEEAGIYSLVLEGIPADLAAGITDSLAIPTIGIGAGPNCDGQVLVIYDLLGFDPDFQPKFLKKYLNGAQIITDCVKSFQKEVKGGEFPGPEHSF